MDAKLLESFVALAKTDREFFHSLSASPSAVLGQLGSTVEMLSATDTGAPSEGELNHSKCQRTSCGTSSFIR